MRVSSVSLDNTVNSKPLVSKKSSFIISQSAKPVSFTGKLTWKLIEEWIDKGADEIEKGMKKVGKVIEEAIEDMKKPSEPIIEDKRTLEDDINDIIRL